MPNCNSFTTILVGNGLGMATNPNAFTIEAGLKQTWSKLDIDLKKRIKSLITQGDELTSEEQLDKHYEVIQACLSLQRFENPSLGWLKNKARDFPDKFNSFVKDVGWYFFEQPSSDKKLIQFVEHMRRFILNHKTHLITLNYDKLLYDHFCTDKEIMNGFNGKLADGFLVDSTGFEPSNLSRYYEKFGWYLHL